MPSNRIRLTAVAAVLGAVAALVFACGASAAVVVSSRITSPADASYFLESPAHKPFTIKGTFKTNEPIKKEEEPEAEVRCYSGVEAAESLSEGEVEEGHFEKLKTDEYEFELTGITAGELGEAPCVLRLVPDANTEALVPGSSTPFEGPRVAGSLFGQTPTAYGLESRSLTSVFELTSAGHCGLGLTQLVNSPQLGESEELFECAGALYGEEPGAGRAAVQVDGHNAFDPYSAENMLARVKPSNLPPSVTVENSFDEAAGLESIHETDPLVLCEGKTAAFPETAESCEKFAEAGVWLERDWTIADGGRLVSMTDTWRSKDAQAHKVSAIYTQELAGDLSSPGTYEFPDAGTAFASTVKGETQAVNAGEGAILYREDGTAAETPGGPHPIGAIILDTSPSAPLSVTDGSAETKGFSAVQMPYSLELPAAGTRSLSMSFAQGYTISEVCALAETVKSSCRLAVANNPSPVNTAPPPPPSKPVVQAPRAGRTGAIKVLRGNITVPLGCSGPAGTTCQVRVTVTTLEKLHGSRISALAAKTRTVTIAGASTAIAAGGRRTVTVKLNALGRSLLARFHKLPLHIAVLQQGISGAAARIAAQNLTLAVKHR